MGKVLKLNVKEIDIYFFGGVTIVEEDLSSSIYKELLMLIAGPLFQLFLVFIIYLLHSYYYVNDLTYERFILINKLLFSFNLLPILPLDGGKILNNILDLFISYRLSHILTIIISFLFIPFLLLIDNKLLIITLMLFLIIKLVNEINIHNDKVNKLILERKIKKYNYKKSIKINNIKNIMRNKNYIIE